MPSAFLRGARNQLVAIGDLRSTDSLDRDSRGIDPLRECRFDEERELIARIQTGEIARRIEFREAGGLRLRDRILPCLCLATRPRAPRRSCRSRSPNLAHGDCETREGVRARAGRRLPPPSTITACPGRGCLGERASAAP